MHVTGKSLVLGVVGDPIEHSLSPKMHAEFANLTGVDAVYAPFHVKAQALKDALAGVPALGLRGVNVTVPHKEAALTLADQLEPAAQTIGAVNTLTNRDGTLVGDNTDARGLLADLKAQFPEGTWQEHPALILGAGGAARAAAYALREAGVPEILVANRTPERAKFLVAELCPEIGKAMGMAEAEIGAALARTGLVINTTSLGLQGEELRGVNLNMAGPNCCVYDLIYSPPETPLLRAGRQQGLAVANGLGMLVRQGAFSFELWTGQSPPITRVIDRLQQRFR